MEKLEKVSLLILSLELSTTRDSTIWLAANSMLEVEGGCKSSLDNQQRVEQGKVASDSERWSGIV